MDGGWRGSFGGLAGERAVSFRPGLLTLQQEVSFQDIAHGLGPRTQSSLLVVVVWPEFLEKGSGKQRERPGEAETRLATGWGSGVLIYGPSPFQVKLHFLGA